jgi:glycosyltransferase involved in cell wall biosynthesis
MRVSVVAEYYPDRHDPSRGIWAHRQALAAVDAGAEVRTIALHRPLPPLRALRQPAELARWAGREARQPRRTRLDGIDVAYPRFIAPPRPTSYARWGDWAAPFARRALESLHAEWPLDLVHAHYAIPAGRAVAGFAARRGLPVVISVHGGDLLDPTLQTRAARRRIGKVLSRAEVVLCNSEYTLDRVAGLGVARGRMRVVRLGATEAAPTAKRGRATIVSSGYLVARKRHEDVLRALARLLRTFPELDYLVVGDGPERARLEGLASDLGVRSSVEFAGQLPPAEALAAVASCHVMALPSVDEAFGVVYGEAMAAGVPAIGCVGEGGPEEIVSLGEGMVTVPPRDPEALAATLGDLLSDPARLARLGDAARATAREHLSWERCGEETVAAYRDALGARS